MKCSITQAFTPLLLIERRLGPCKIGVHPFICAKHVYQGSLDPWNHAWVGMKGTIKKEILLGTGNHADECACLALSLN